MYGVDRLNARESVPVTSEEMQYMHNQRGAKVLCSALQRLLLCLDYVLRVYHPSVLLCCHTIVLTPGIGVIGQFGLGHWHLSGLCPLC